MKKDIRDRGEVIQRKERGKVTLRKGKEVQVVEEASQDGEDQAKEKKKRK